MKEEILTLNLLRFFAALGILFVHKFSSLIDLGYIPEFLKFLSPLTEHGYLGVNLFFLISGFVITLSSEGRTFGEFISARFIRLFPVFWICVSITTLFTLLMSSVHISLFQYLANLTMMPHYYGEYAFIDGSYWTLEIELRFYLFIAFILFIKTFINVSLQKIALLISLPLLCHTLFYNPYSSSFLNVYGGYILMPFGYEYAQYFIAGILFYGIYKENKAYYNYIAIALCYCAAIIQALDHSYATNSPTIIVLHITLFFGLFLAISLKKIPNTSYAFLGTAYKKILVTLGAITYPLYLLHSVILNILIENIKRHEVSNYIACILLFIILATLIYYVNKIDFYLHQLWKKSSVIKNIMARVRYPCNKDNKFTKL